MVVKHTVFEMAGAAYSYFVNMTLQKIAQAAQKVVQIKLETTDEILVFQLAFTADYIYIECARTNTHKKTLSLTYKFVDFLNTLEGVE